MSDNPISPAAAHGGCTSSSTGRVHSSSDLNTCISRRAADVRQASAAARERCGGAVQRGSEHQSVSMRVPRSNSTKSYIGSATCRIIDVLGLSPARRERSSGAGRMLKPGAHAPRWPRAATRRRRPMARATSAIVEAWPQCRRQTYERIAELQDQVDQQHRALPRELVSDVGREKGRSAAALAGHERHDRRQGPRAWVPAILSPMRSTAPRAQRCQRVTAVPRAHQHASRGSGTPASAWRTAAPPRLPGAAL